MAAGLSSVSDWFLYIDSQIDKIPWLLGSPKLRNSFKIFPDFYQPVSNFFIFDPFQINHGMNLITCKYKLKILMEAYVEYFYDIIRYWQKKVYSSTTKKTPKNWNPIVSLFKPFLWQVYYDNIIFHILFMGGSKFQKSNRAFF